jgi:GNAT superfamily N-acetyltransferase
VEIRRGNIDENNQILKVLNEATLDLITKGVNQWSFPWKSEYIEQNLNFSYVLIINQNIIGTFFINEIDALCELQIPKDSIYLSKIALLPNYQGKKIGLEIINFACSLAVKLNKTLYLDCWSGNKKLKDFYSNSGLDYVGDFPQESYFISVFRYN